MQLNCHFNLGASFLFLSKYSMGIVSDMANFLLWIDFFMRKLVVKEEKNQIESALKSSGEFGSDDDSACLMILREKLSAMLEDDDGEKSLNLEELEKGLSALEESIRRSRTSPIHKSEVSKRIMDQKNMKRSRLSLSSYLKSVKVTHHWRGRSFNNIRIQNRRKENLRRYSTFLATLTFPLFLFSTIFIHPLEKSSQESLNSLLLTLFALLNFLAFISAASIMILVQARFTLTQIIVLLTSTMVLNICSSNFFIFTLISIPIVAILCFVWHLHTNSSPS